MCVEARIKRYLVNQGIAQKEVCAKTGISTSKMCLTLNGHRRMSFPEYESICWALGVPVTMFIRPRKPKKSYLELRYEGV